MERAIGFGPAGVDWQQRINFTRMREERSAKVKSLMKKYNIPALLLNVSENKRYAIGKKSSVLPLILDYILFFAEEDPIVYEHADIGIHLKKNSPWLNPDNIRAAYTWVGGIVGPNATKITGDKWAKAIQEDLKQKGLDKEPLGIDALDAVGREALREAGIKTVDCSALMAAARIIKTEDEINCLRMAAAIVDRAWWAMYEKLHPGIRECELAAIAYKTLYEMNIEYARVWGASGSRAWPNPRGSGSTDRIVQPGELVFFDIYDVSYCGYKTCYYRTFCVGRRPTAKQKDWYKQCYDWIYEALSEVKPGTTTADAAKRFPEAKLWGYPGEHWAVLSQWGHGIGLSLYEKPVISRAYSFDDPIVFEKNMTFAIETQQGEEGVGGARLEEMVVVTDTGYEVISLWPAEDITVATHSLVE
jgi:Xaa-Pro aminopeptidase